MPGGRGGGGGTLSLLERGANLLIWGLQFGSGIIILGLKIRGPKCAICSLKFGVGEIIWNLIFVTCRCRSLLFQPFS